MWFVDYQSFRSNKNSKVSRALKGHFSVVGQMGEVTALTELTGNRGTSRGTEYGKRGPLMDFRLIKGKWNW
jgi:hypothetical protein